MTDTATRLNWTVDESGSVDRLAKMLAQENITIMYKPVPTASFYPENRVLVLPNWQMPRVCKVMLTLHEVGHALFTPYPDWDNAIYELAWSLKSKDNMTPSIQSRMTAKDFLNVVEDPRIEKLIKRRYPGSISDFGKGYQLLTDRNFFGKKEPTILALAQNKVAFIDRLNLYFKAPFVYMPTFSKEEMVFVKRIEDQETFEDAKKISFDLLHFELKRRAMAAEKKKQAKVILKIKGAPETEQEEPEVEDPKRERDYHLGGSKEAFDNDDDVEAESEENETKESVTKSKKGPPVAGMGPGSHGDEAEPDESDDDIEADDESDDEDDSGDHDDLEPPREVIETETVQFSQSNPFEKDKALEKAEEEALGEEVLEVEAGDLDNLLKDLLGKTQENFEEALEKVGGSNKKTIYSTMYVDIPEFHYEKIVDDYPKVLDDAKKCLAQYKTGDNAYRQPILKLMKEENKVISFMLKEFDMKKAADKERRTLTARTGKLDMNRMHQYRYNDDLFKKLKIEPGDESNHGFILVLDGSSSMSQHLYATGKQLFALALFCRRAQIPFDVYIFRDAVSHKESYQRCHDELADPHLSFDNFKLRCFLSSRMNPGQFMTGCQYLLCYMVNHGTAIDPLTYTPLVQTMAALPGMVQKFRAMHHNQIMNVIIMSDGDSNPCHMGGSEEVYKADKEALENGKIVEWQPVLRDKKTRKEYELITSRTSTSGISTTEVEIALLQRIRDTQSNILGFFLTNQFGGVMSKINTYNRLLGKPWATKEDEAALKSEWKQEGFLGYENAGYDEYYFMRHTEVAPNPTWGDDFLTRVKDSDKLLFKEKGAIRKLEKAFMEELHKKTINRRLLRTFVNRICKFETKRGYHGN
jgi:hypothetical protein